MKLKSCIAFVQIMLICTGASAEPYQFDTRQPAPRALALFDDPENEGVKLGLHEGVMANQANRFILGGYSEYQPVDVFLFSKSDNTELEIGLLQATWEDRQQSCNTGSEGYCQLKFRSFDGVGMDVNGPAGAAFAIAVVVGAEVQPVFDMPFYKVSEGDLDKLQDGADAGNPGNKADSDEASGSWLLYAIVALLVFIAALLVVLLRQKARVNTALALLLSVAMVYAPDSSAAEPNPGNPRSWLENQREEQETDQERRDREAEEAIDRLRGEMHAEFGRFRAAFDAVTGTLGRFETAIEKIDELRELKASYDSLRSAYEGLGHCIASAPRFVSPRIPSFCDYDYGTGVSGVRGGGTNCATCFLDSRTAFNQTRNTFARLETIYKCTKKMTTSAMAFGDSFSTATKSGLGWYSARKNIEQSETKLEAAYDNKYNDLLGQLHGSLVEMSICEAQYGLQDWYDRFGFVYYEFMADRYRRVN